mgnify:CR=1 FL=1
MIALNIDMLHGTTVPVKVTVRYFQPALATELPSEEQTITLKNYKIMNNI